MVKVETISMGEADEFAAGKPKRGRWAELIGQVKEGKGARKVSGLTRGQVAGIYRQCKDSGVKCVTDYKNGVCVLSAE